MNHEERGTRYALARYATNHGYITSAITKSDHTNVTHVATTVPVTEVLSSYDSVDVVLNSSFTAVSFAGDT